MSFPLKPFVYVSLKDWCRPAASIEELESRSNSYLLHGSHAGFQRFGPPDFYADSDRQDVEVYGRNEFISVWPYNVPVWSYSVWNDHVFMANVSDALLLRDNFFEGRCHLFLREGIAAAETYHSITGSNAASRLAREQFPLLVENQEILVNLYRDWPAQDHDPTEGVLMTHMMMDNYAHFLNEVIPRFWWLDAMPSLRRFPILMPRYLEGSYQHEVLAPLLQGLDVRPLAAPAARFKRLFVPTFLANGSYSREMIQFTDRTVRTALGLSRVKKRRKRLYLSRDDATQRRVLNEREVIDALAPLGFECHVTGKMTVRQQVELFSQAEMIVGPHGAGLANIVFAPEESVLIELLAHPYLHPMYWIIAKLNGMRYARLVEPAATEQFDLHVNVRRLVSAIETFLP